MKSKIVSKKTVVKAKVVSKKKTVKAKVVGKKKLMRKVEFKRGGKNILIMSEKRKGESDQDHDNRIEFMKVVMADAEKAMKKSR